MTVVGCDLARLSNRASQTDTVRLIALSFILASRHEIVAKKLTVVRPAAASYRPLAGDGTSLRDRSRGVARSGPTTVRLATVRAQATSIQRGADRADPGRASGSPPVAPGNLRDGEAGRVFHNERGGPFNEASGRGPGHGSRRSPRSRSSRRWRADRMTCGTRRRRSGSTTASPSTEVARRLGHDVAVLLKIYVNCIDGQEDAINDRITAVLTAGQDHETLPATPAVHHAASQPRGPEPGR